MYNNYTSNSDSSKRMKELVDGYKRFRSQTSQPTSLLRDKGEGMLNVDEKQKNTTTSPVSGNFSSDNMPSLLGDDIKKRLQKAYANKEPTGNKNLFDDIDSKAIEKMSL